MTLQERFIDHLGKVFANCLGTLKAKNNDYTKNSTVDPFRNFRKMADFGHIDVDQALLSQIGAKLSRLEALTEPGFVAQVDEPLEDTLRDLINYFAILKTWYEMGQPDPEEPESVSVSVAEPSVREQVEAVGQRVKTLNQKVADLFKK